MVGCAVGSVRGYDELFPKRIDLVKESRKYENLNLSFLDEVGQREDSPKGDNGSAENYSVPPLDLGELNVTIHQDEERGIMRARRVLNELHDRLEREGFTEQHVHHDGSVIVIQARVLTPSLVVCISDSFSATIRARTRPSTASATSRLRDSDRGT